MKKSILYIILISGILPSTWLFGLSMLGLYAMIPNFEISIGWFATLISILMGLCGFWGLLSLINGLHQTNHSKKIILLSTGVIGFILFLSFVSPRNAIEWLMETEPESLIGKLPIAVSLIFLILTINDKKKVMLKESN